MIGLHDFYGFCRKSALDERDMRALYKSFRKTIFLAENGKRQYFSELEREYKIQRELFSGKEIPKNSELGKFIAKSVRDEREIKRQGSEKLSAHTINRLLVEYSIERIRILLKYSRSDAERYVRIGKIFQHRLKRSRQQKLKGVGLIAGLAAVGIGTGWIAYSKFRNGKESDESKK